MFEVVTPAAVEPIDADDVTAHLQAGTLLSDQTDIVAIYITTAIQWLENRLHRQLCTATWKYHMRDFPGEIVIPDKLPHASISSIAYTDTNGDPQTYSSSLYQTDIGSDNRPARIMPVYGQTFPNVRSDTYQAVTVTFVAGYGGAADVPSGIKTALCMLVANMYENRESMAPMAMHDIPFGVEALIQPYDWGCYA